MAWKHSFIKITFVPAHLDPSKTLNYLSIFPLSLNQITEFRLWKITRKKYCKYIAGAGNNKAVLTWKQRLRIAIDAAQGQTANEDSPSLSLSLID